MQAPLSSNEMEILDQHVATLKFHLDEVANLLESRLSKCDLATDARRLQQSFQAFASQVHKHVTLHENDHMIVEKIEDHPLHVSRSVHRVATDSFALRRSINPQRS
jgi:hypothetical protein